MLSAHERDDLTRNFASYMPYQILPRITVYTAVRLTTMGWRIRQCKITIFVVVIFDNKCKNYSIVRGLYYIFYTEDIIYRYYCCFVETRCVKH